MQLITPAQCRAARALLNWTQPELAEHCGTHVQTVSNFEKESGSPTKTTLKKIAGTFENIGISFIQQTGVELKANPIQIYNGRDGFWDFYEGLYEAVKKSPGEVLVSNVDERLYEKWLSPEKIDTHVARIKALGVTYKILISEGDDHLLATPDYAEYRWMPKTLFSTASFYVFGDKMALLLFEEEVRVIVIDAKDVADAYRKQFTSLWDISAKIER